jgi:hypothetical protein
MSAPLRTYAVTFVETIFATVTVEAATEDAACDHALAEYRADPDSYMSAGGGVQVLHCVQHSEEASQ